MTFRDSRFRKGIGRHARGLNGRTRDRRWRNQQRRHDRRLLSETLEQRQLLAGPDLIGVQPNSGSLINGGEVLTVSPNELVFRFDDDDSNIDPTTLSAIRITRAGDDGVFESATALSDLGTNGGLLVEFRAIESGSLGNGIQVQFTSSFRTGSNLPIVSVSGRTVLIDVNNNPSRPTRVQELVTTVRNHPLASQLIEVIPVTGGLLSDIGTKVPNGLTLTLRGANSAQTVTDLGSGGAVSVRLVSQIPGQEGLATTVELQRVNFGGPANPVVVVNNRTVQVQLNSSAGNETTVSEFINAINSSAAASAILSADLEKGQGTFAIGGLAGLPQSLTLSGVTDVVVSPGFIGLGDSPREVVFRFAEPLPDDMYQIDILGTGPGALKNVNGELFQDGNDLTRKFSINLGPKVVAVVPEPVRRTSTGQLTPQIGFVEVHFNNDRLNVALAETPAFYQLIYTRDTVDNGDDIVIEPNSVDYNLSTNIATLDFGLPLSRIPDPAVFGQFVGGAARLRVGMVQDPSGNGLPAEPTEISLLLDPNNPIEPGDSFDTAFDLNSQWTINSDITSARLRSEVFNTAPFDLTLPGPDVAGTREIRSEDPSRLLRTVPLDYLRGGPDAVEGISVIQYDFPDSWLGDDPTQPGILEDKTYFNIISEQQKQRVREVMSLYSEYLGISFIEVEGQPTSNNVVSIAVGDLYGGDERAVSGDGGLAVVTRDRNGDGIDDLGVMDFQDFDESIDDQFGGEFFRGSMFVVGQLLGYGYADDLGNASIQGTDFIFAGGNNPEPVFPAVADIVNGQFLYRPESTDIDLYRFTLAARGTLSIETIAERLGDASLLDSALRLYRLGPDGSAEMIAQNDDYFSNDSLIELEVDAGSYVVGVSARGNTDYDPSIAGSGFGGLSEGDYELVLQFRRDSANAILDSTGVPLDGDGDNRPGGVFDFWFVPSSGNETLYVDKAAGPTATPNGTIVNPFRNIDDALAAAAPGQTVRVVGNGGIDGNIATTQDNFSYKIGFANNGAALEDGTSLNLPRGVRLVIDAGAILKMSRSRIGVGSVSPSIDVSDSALQVLGTPSIINSFGVIARDSTGAAIPGSVYFTSINDTTLGMGNPTTSLTTLRSGDWGGIDFRGDLDTADESRRNRENEGVFLNHIQFADLRYGGGPVSIGGRQVVVSPIDMAVTRATILNSHISRSADAAIAATPDTFAETRFTDPRSQSAGAFTPDYSRVGPKIQGNIVNDNSINGLFVRVATRTGGVLETLQMQSRFDDTDITHVLTENLVIEGTAGGPILQSSAPSTLSVRSRALTSGNVLAGTYTYRITNVDASGQESAASPSTTPVRLATIGSIELSQLPPAGPGFTARRLYRATINPTLGLPGDFRLVATLNAGQTTFIDNATGGTTLLSTAREVLRSRFDASLVVDPGTVVKVDGARIEARFGANLIAEGMPGRPVIFTSLEDQRYGSGGTFDTNDRGNVAGLSPGDWGGLYVGTASTVSIDQAVIAGAGGTTRIAGGFASFNAIEVHQGNLRLTNTRLEQNADGRSNPAGDRVGRGDNATGAVFVRGATPVIGNNLFLDGQSEAVSIDVNSLSSRHVNDPGRSTGIADPIDVVGNQGPLIHGNTLQNNAINAMHVRGGELATNGVWDDVDIVHFVSDTIEVPNRFVFGGLRLQSDARGSLVVKFQQIESNAAGIVVGGTLLSAADQFRDINDRVGGSLQVIGHPDFPVVLTALADDSSGAGFTLNGDPQTDTDNNGISGLDSNPRLPTGPEVDNGTLIDNDVDPATPGFFNFQPGPGGERNLATGVGSAATTVRGITQIFQQQDSLFEYGHFVDVGADGGAVRFSATNITLQPTLIGDDRVVSEGNFQGENGQINWRVEQFFDDGGIDLISEITLTSSDPLGDVRFINYYDPVIGTDAGDILFTEGTPGEQDFRLTILDGPEEIGFRQYGTFVPGDGLQGATYEGWIADDFPDLITAPEFNLAFTPTGTVDLASVPLLNDSRFPTPNYGTGILTSAMAWLVDPGATSATVTTNLQVIAEVFGTPVSFAGAWNGITVREAADDRNVAAIAEQEPTRSVLVDINPIPGQSQFLGEIAPNQLSGDESRRLGFIVDGAISTRDDLDVYSFIAESGTEVWLDVDQTSAALDSVVELIDANGRVLAASNDSLSAEAGMAGLFTAPDIGADTAQPLSLANNRLPVQLITVSESIVDATGGFLSFSIPGSTVTANVAATAFRIDPAGSIEAALEATFSELGPITATLQRRTARTVDPQNGTVVTRFGDDFVIQLVFNEASFIGKSVPLLAATESIVGAAVMVDVDSTFLSSQVQDAFSSNSKDAGMRLRLPGEPGTRNLYHIRVRSSNTASPTDFATLVDPARVRDGISLGRYQLQVRLGEADERAGTQIRHADVRNATDGLHIIGQPFHSPLTGSDAEVTTGGDTLATAQSVTGPLQSDQLASSISGALDSATDVDWYTFDIDYQNLTRDAAALYLSTVFDLDFASGFARPDMALYVFNGQGELVLIGGNSNIADDLPTGQSSVTELSRGSASTEDPYIGAAELSEGTYFVAVANQQQVPLPLDQFFNRDTANPLLRLEPVDSVTRIAEDHIGSSGGGTATAPEIPLLFDDASIVPFSLDDVLLYVNTGTSLHVVNPFTGAHYLPGTSLGNFGDEFITDVAFRANGELFAYTENGPVPADAATDYVRINTSTAALTVLGQTGVVTNHLSDPTDATIVTLDVVTDEGLDVEAITIREFNGAENGFLIANRPTAQVGLQYSTNILYEFDDQTGALTGPPFDLNRAAAGAGTTPREVGRINTAPGNAVSRVLGLTNASLPGVNGVLMPNLFDGNTFRIASDSGASVIFELNQGFTLVANGTDPIEGEAVTVTTAAGSFIFEFELGDGIRVNAGSTLVPVTADIEPQDLITALANAMRTAGVQVTEVGTQLVLPNATALVETSGAVAVAGTPGVTGTNTPVMLSPTDTAQVLATRIAQAIQQAVAGGSLPNVVAVATGRSVTLTGGRVAAVSGNLIAAGIPNGGLITGVELLNDSLYAVSNTGGLYAVDSATLATTGNRDVGSYVATSSDLIGISFTGLRAGPASLDGGAFSDILFGIVGNGDIYAFDTSGELQPIFAGGRTRVSTGIAGAEGLDFGVLDYNLWHATAATADTPVQRGTDPGHGIDPLFNGTRGVSTGGSSLAFTFETTAFASNYPSEVEVPTFSPRQDGAAVEDTYNFPGGAKGAVISNPFSLDGYAPADQPVLYFNYYMETEAVAGRDALRVYVVTEDGVEHLTATNNTNTFAGLRDDEFDDPDLTDEIDADVQLLFDTNGSVNDTWRQARVPLDNFAGESNLRLRVEFATSGSTLSTSAAIATIDGESIVAAATREFTLSRTGGVDQQTFVLSLAPTIAFPTGSQLATLYVNQSQTAVVTIDGQSFLLQDGTRTPGAGQTEINLLAGLPTGTTLSDLSASQIADAFATQAFPLVASNVTASDNFVEFNGGQAAFSTSQPALIVITNRVTPGTSVPIPVSRFMTAAEIATAVQAALATRYAAGNTIAVPTSGNHVSLGGFEVQSLGPFGTTADRYQFPAGFRAGTENNTFEGVYLDDFVIGFAERGEIATSSNSAAGAFIADGRRLFPQPDNPTSSLTSGSYQIEIRDASEYVNSLGSSRFRTFETNDRLISSGGTVITSRAASEFRDGATFAISNGRTNVTFEFNLREANNGVTPGNVAIRFTNRLVDPSTGVTRPETAAEVAANIIAAINRSDVQQALGSPAVPAVGSDGGDTAVINLSGRVTVIDEDGVLAGLRLSSGRGDQNRVGSGGQLGQGVLIVENSQFLFNEGYGIVLSHGTTANVLNQDTDSFIQSPKNLVELNSENLVPGVVIQSSVMAFNSAGGIQINGIPAGTGLTSADPVGYDRILNNSIIGGTISVGNTFVAGGNGVEIVGNAAPVLLNNILANTSLGIQVDPSNTLTVLGGNTFYRNTANVPAGVSVGQFAQLLPNSEVVFVSPAELVFVPAAGASIIDSSIDSLEDRVSLTAVKNPLGLPPSPILAPSFDINGQLRTDDPTVEPPGGLGERVFKDRGASDRGDLVGPRVVLRTPQGPDLGPNAGMAAVLGTAPRFFEAQLLDGLAPADVVPGTGIDDRTVTGDSIQLFRNNSELLVEGVDYRFGYNPSTNVIRLTPIAGVWEENTTYIIRFTRSGDGTIMDEVGNPIQGNQADGTTALVIFVSGGFDYGDAPSPYASAAALGGPRHAVDPQFALAPAGVEPSVTPDADARLPDGDDDNGIRIFGVIEPGFITNFEVNVLNPDGRQFFVDVWFDWDRDNLFEINERLVFGSAGTGRSVLSAGANVISVAIPSDAVPGETYARFRLSESSTLGPTGDATSGEVEDIRLLVSNNRFQNPVSRFDVNGSGNVSAIDALQIVNAMTDFGGPIDLSGPLPPNLNLPMFPDVNGDGRVSALDALEVVTFLAALPNSSNGEFVGEGESNSFVPVSSGLMASRATLLGDEMLAAADPVDPPAEIEQPAEKTSVFDLPASIQLDELVETLAADAATQSTESTSDAIDEVFSLI